MRAFYALWKKELQGYFLSPIAYVVLIFFLLLMGVSLWFLVDMLSGGMVAGSVMQTLFGESIFFWVAMLIAIPVITMRLLAEEVKLGTMEGLLTAPVAEHTVVLAKFAGALSFFICMWLPTAAYAFIIRGFDPDATVDIGPMCTAYLGTLLIGSCYVALGLLASSLTRNQVVAAIICFALVGISFFAGFIPYVAANPAIRQTAAFFSPVIHMMDFSRGVVDTRPLILYITTTGTLLFASIQVVQSGKWK